MCSLRERRSDLLTIIDADIVDILYDVKRVQ